MTREGTVLGTARYMAPEVLMGGEPSMRSDLYAAGLVLFELLEEGSSLPGRGRKSAAPCARLERAAPARPRSRAALGRACTDARARPRRAVSGCRSRTPGGGRSRHRAGVRRAPREHAAELTSEQSAERSCERRSAGCSGAAVVVARGRARECAFGPARPAAVVESARHRSHDLEHRPGLPPRG